VVTHRRGPDQTTWTGGCRGYPSFYPWRHPFAAPAGGL